MTVDAGRKPATPFVVPGNELNPDRPLEPGRPDNLVDHELYYCDAGGHLDAYRRFTSLVGTPQELCRTGGLIVVGGPEQSGKTSLVNRCVNWLRTGMTGAGDCLVFECVTGVGRGLTVEQRCQRVAERIMDEIRQLGRGDLVPDPAPIRVEGALRTLARVRKDLGGTDLFIVLAPPMEHDSYQKEIEHYRERFEPGVVCFLEYSTDQLPRAGQDRNPPIMLGLRYLRAGEASRIVREWPGADEVRPAMGQEALRQFEQRAERAGWNLSTKMVLAILREIHQSRKDGVHRSKGLDSEVDCNEITDCMISVLMRLRGTGASY